MSTCATNDTYMLVLTVFSSMASLRGLKEVADVSVLALRFVLLDDLVFLVWDLFDSACRFLCLPLARVLG